ncbi:MAG TPA: hypothetical protein VFU11_00960 [Solirubrobacterales bacterium]|nr:hypothetical protein [Solirubrobacterales bacterium]
MAVMSPREQWTDERLDDLNKKVDDGFVRVEGDLRELRVEVRDQGRSLQAEVKSQGESLRGEMNAHFAKLDERLAKFDDRLDRVYGAGVAIVVALIGSHTLF